MAYRWFGLSRARGAAFALLIALGIVAGCRASDEVPPTSFSSRSTRSGPTIPRPRSRGTRLGVRKGRWKSIEGGEGEKRELYDLRTDPSEHRNRIADQRDRAEALEAILADWRRSRDRRGEIAELPEEDRKALEALGYLP